jgi:hemerythrin-like domain-containing protein
MYPTSDIRGEHSVMKIILLAMKKLVYDIRESINAPDLSRIGQISDFLTIFTIHCHYEKEEKGLFAALIDLDIPYVTLTIHQLIAEHNLARGYIEELARSIEKYLSGQYVPFLSISSILSDFVVLEEQHMRKEDIVVLPLCEKLLSVSKLRTISTNFRIIQNEQVGHARHFEYYILLNQLYSENKLINRITNP